jgi:hypothetical protein
LKLGQKWLVGLGNARGCTVRLGNGCGGLGSNSKKLSAPDKDHSARNKLRNKQKAVIKQ